MSSWDGKSKGTVIGYRIVIFCLRSLGLKSTYALVRIISRYYYYFSAAPKRQLMDFYHRRLGYPVREAKALVRLNFYRLAQSLLDRVALTIGEGNRLQFISEQRELMKSWGQDERGTILISAHFGNWAAAGQMFKGKVGGVNVVMVENEVAALRAYFEKSGLQPDYNIISISDDMSHFIKIYAALKRGEFVAIHGDRFLPGNPTLSLTFGEGKAQFPLGPFQLVEKLKARCAFVFAVKEDTFTYRVTAVEAQSQTAEQLAAEYAQNLESQVKKSPENWFNYHDFYRH